MNPPIIPEPRTESAGRLLLKLVAFVALLTFLGLALLGVAVVNALRVGRDTAALRDAVLASAGAAGMSTVEFRAPGLLLGLARAGLTFVDLDPEARAVLRSVRGGEVGVYRLNPGRSRHDTSDSLSAADAAMAGKGWDRVVGVIHGHEMVAVYIPQDLSSARDVRFCVAVLTGRDLVVVGARGNLEPLLALVQEPWLAKSGLEPAIRRLTPF